MREFKGYDSFLGENARKRAYELRDIRDVSKYVICDHEVCGNSFSSHLACRLQVEKGDPRVYVARTRGIRHVQRRFYTEHWNAGGEKMLKQISVIRRNFDDHGFRTKSKTRYHRVCILACMLDPCIRV